MKIKANIKGILLRNRAQIRNNPHFKIWNEQINDSKRRNYFVKKNVSLPKRAVASFSNIIENNYPVIV